MMTRSTSSTKLILMAAKCLIECWQEKVGDAGCHCGSNPQNAPYNKVSQSPTGDSKEKFTQML